MANISQDAADPCTPTRNIRSPPHTTRSHRSDYSTPLNNIISGSQASEKAKAKLVSVAPNGERCLVTLDRRPLNCCHILPISHKYFDIDELEHAWGFTTGALHLHTTRNMIWLRSEMHTTFDWRDWALVPTRSTLNSILAEAILNQDKKKPALYNELFPDRIWEYHFVPFVRSPIAFLRFSDDLESFATHQYPFGSLGTLKSHVHPFFVICNTAEKELRHRKQSGYFADNGESPLSPPSRSIYRDHLTLCVQIFAFWAPNSSKSLSLPRPSPPSPPRFPEPSTTPTRSSSAGHSASPRRTTVLSLRQQDAGQDVYRASETRDAEPSFSAEQDNSQSTDYVESSLQSNSHSSTAEVPPKLVVHGEDSVEDNIHELVRYWTSVGDWAKHVENSGPCRDLYAPEEKAAVLYLEHYGRERARRPPRGPWEQWMPEYELS